MTLEEIRKNRPPQATHYSNNDIVKYYRLNKHGQVCIYNSSGIGGYQCLHIHVSKTVLKPL